MEVVQEGKNNLSSSGPVSSTNRGGYFESTRVFVHVTDTYVASTALSIICPNLSNFHLNAGGGCPENGPSPFTEKETEVPRGELTASLPSPTLCWLHLLPANHSTKSRLPQGLCTGNFPLPGMRFPWVLAWLSISHQLCTCDRAAQRNISQCLSEITHHTPITVPITVFYFSLETHKTS